MVHFVGLLQWTTGGLMPVTIRHSHLPSHQISPLHHGHSEVSLSGRLSPSLFVGLSGRVLQEPSHVYPLPGLCRDQQEAMLPGSGGRLGYQRGHLQMSLLLLATMQIALASLLPDLWDGGLTLLSVLPITPER